MKKDVYILAIETSCDETSFSIVKNGKFDIATSISSQIDIHKNYGGVVPEIASREHLKNFIFVLKEVLEKSKMKLFQNGVKAKFPSLLSQLFLILVPKSFNS